MATAAVRMDNSWAVRRSEHQLVTSQVAEEWLKRNTSNRSFRPNLAAKYAAAIDRGEWLENGDAIRFASDGTLLDGQHRLAAIVRSGKSLWMRVEFGLGREAFATIDRGTPRTMGDILGQMGAHDANRVAASLSWILRYRHWLTSGSVKGGLFTPSPTQVMEFYEAEAWDIAASVAATRSTARLIRSSLPVAAHWLCARESREHADLFFDQVGNGIGLEKGHPALALRERIIANTLAKAKVSNAEVLVMMIRAWNAFVTNRPVLSLKGFVGEGGAPEVMGPPWKVGPASESNP